MSRLYKFFRPLIMTLPPEFGHSLALQVFKILSLIPMRHVKDPLLQSNVLGLDFLNPIGLAAGFDKDAEAPRALLKACFGFVEVGTVTPKPQPGNPRPRIFRLIEDKAVVNRLGFNNKGFAAALKRLTALPRGKFRGVLGVNIGANKDSQDPVTDYLKGLETFYDVADYFTVNISSPNTPGLRDLQAGKKLETLLDKLNGKRAKLKEKSTRAAPPLFLKIAPDLKSGQLKEIVTSAIAAGIDGLIISNTTVDRPENLVSKNKEQEGGLSGRPLFDPSTKLLAEAYKLSKGKLVLIGVGGVFSAADVYRKILAGASLVQLYTGLVYEGPGLARTLNRDLAYILRSEGYSNISEAIGKGIEK